MLRQVRAAAKIKKAYGPDRTLVKAKKPTLTDFGDVNPEDVNPEDAPEDPVDPASVDDLEFDLGDIDLLEQDFADALEAAAVDASVELLGQVGLDEDQDIVDQVSERAVEAARDQAAELVSDIDESTRSMLQDLIAGALEDNVGLSELTDMIAESAAFGEDRASLIASTEVRNANERGVVEGLRGARDAGNVVYKVWLAEEDACDICQGNADDGPIDVDDVFSSGDSEPTAHVRCRCAVTGEIGEDETDQPDVGNNDAIEALYRISKDFNPDQPRDDRGRWESGGNSDLTRHDTASDALAHVNYDPTTTGPDIQQKIDRFVANLPVEALKESSLRSVVACDNPEDASEAIGNFLNKIGSDEDPQGAVGVFDRSTGTLITSVWDSESLSENGRNFYHEFAHSLGDRIVSDEWEKAFPEWSTHGQDEGFAEAFSSYMVAKNDREAMSDLVYNKPLTVAMFHSWGW